MMKFAALVLVLFPALSYASFHQELGSNVVMSCGQKSNPHQVYILSLENDITSGRSAFNPDYDALTYYSSLQHLSTLAGNQSWVPGKGPMLRPTGKSSRLFQKTNSSLIHKQLGIYGNEEYELDLSSTRGDTMKLKNLATGEIVPCLLETQTEGL